MNCFSNSFLIFVFILCNGFAQTHAKRGKTNIKSTQPTDPPDIELEPEVEPEVEPGSEETTTEFIIPEWEPGYSRPEGNWHPIVITQKPPRPEPGWRPVTITTTSSPEHERTTRRTPKPEPEWTRPTRRTTPRPEPTKRTTPWPEPWWTTPARRTTPRPVPERTTIRTTHRPEPEWAAPTRRTTQRPEPERTTTTTTPEPEPETTTKRPRPEVEAEPPRPITTTTRKPYPEPEHEYPPQPESPQHPGLPGMQPGCFNMRCPHGYRCDCINPCPATCRAPNRKPCTIYACKVGCVCDKGYLLNDNNTCVPLRECQRPPIHEGIVCNELCTDGKQCGCENPCPATCDNPDPTPCPTLQCNPGCYTVCRKGFVLDRVGGDCIPLQYCPNRQCIAQVCTQHENEIYYECSTRVCNRTCDAPNRRCGGQCIKPGNFDCKPGYVRDERTGKCVLPQHCEQQIRCERKDEVFYECDTRMCQRTCQRPNSNCADICRQPGNCDCRPGLVRDVKTCRCVDKSEKSCLAQRISDD